MKGPKIGCVLVPAKQLGQTANVKIFQPVMKGLLGAGFACLLNFNCPGFALLGPYEDWMQASNSFRLSGAGGEVSVPATESAYTTGDIGGPMPLGAEYRWNVPVLSYAFDGSFIEYFGAEGVQEVEAAIKLLNKLPPASQINLTNYPTDVLGMNYAAQVSGIIDLKSTAMTLLLEQLGLAQPTRNIYILRQWEPFLTLGGNDLNWPDYYPEHIFKRNFAPELCLPTNVVNGGWFFGLARSPVWPGSKINDVIEVLFAPVLPRPAVADGFPNPGYYFSGFSRDDVGGLKYLLSFTNINFEASLPDVRWYRTAMARGTIFPSHSDGQWRPGVDKITFVRHPYIPARNRSLLLRHRYTDYFYAGGILQSARAERAILQPDFLFTADSGEDTPENQISIHAVVRTTTTNWLNNATANGNQGGPGPGIITPGIKIAFRQLGSQVVTLPASGSWIFPRSWGSFKTNGAIITSFPNQLARRVSAGEMVVRQVVMETGKPSPISARFWKLPVPASGVALLQAATDQTAWTTQANITNNQTVMEWLCVDYPSNTVFRVVSQ